MHTGHLHPLYNTWGMIFLFLMTTEFRVYFFTSDRKHHICCVWCQVPNQESNSKFNHVLMIENTHFAETCFMMIQFMW